MKKFLKALITVLGLAPLLTSYLIIMWIFFAAYLSEGKVLILINKFNEANIEIVGIIITIPFVLNLIYKIFKY